MPPRAAAVRGGQFSTGGDSGWGDAGAAFSEAVALALQGDHRGVVHEPVDERGGDHRVAEVAQFSIPRSGALLGA